MNRFIIDFEGEEEAEPDPHPPYPKYIIFWWDSKRSLMDDCRSLHTQGIPMQIVKYIFKDLVGADNTGWGIGVDIGDVSSGRLEMSGTRKYHDIQINWHHDTRDKDFIYSRSCWVYEEIAPVLSFFESIPYSPGMVI